MSHAKLEMALGRPDAANLADEEVTVATHEAQFTNAVTYLACIFEDPQTFVGQVPHLFFGVDASGLQTPPSEALAAEVSLSAFRATNHIFRKLFAMREFEIPKGTAIRKEVGARISHAILLLNKLSYKSSGVRDRIANDVEMIDNVLYWTAEVVRDPASFADQLEGDPRSSPPAILDHGLRFVGRAGLQKSKPFREHVEKKMLTFQRDLFVEELFPAAKKLFRAEDTDWPLESARVLATIIGQILSAFYLDFFAQANLGADYHKMVSKKIDSGNLPDTCDQCGSPAPLGTKLQRCSRCKVARYCSSSCQTLAWKSRHKDVCWKGGDAGK